MAGQGTKAISTRRFTSVGWWGYFGCAVLYVIAGLRAGDLLTTAGSVLFLAATVSFLIPHLATAKEIRDDA